MSNKSSKRISQRILNQLVPELRESSYYRDEFRPTLLKTIHQLGVRKIGHIVCYGLGSFHNGTEIASRYQLALLILLYEELVDAESPIKNVIEIFDPSFEQPDLEILSSVPHFKFHVIDENEHCARELGSNSQVTLFYMPHLDKHLYNNLLGANWCPESVNNLVVLGNSFQAMIDYETPSVCRSKLYYINLLVNNFVPDTTKSDNRRKSLKTNLVDKSRAESCALVEHIVENSDPEYSDIFNNFAFHFISESWLAVNKSKIDQHRLVGWKRVIATDSDSGWHDD